MILKRLTISPERPFSAPGPKNRYMGEIMVSWEKSELKVTLSEECAERVLEMVADEIAEAARVQVDGFVQQALAHNRVTQIEGEVE